MRLLVVTSLAALLCCSFARAAKHTKPPVTPSTPSVSTGSTATTSLPSTAGAAATPSTTVAAGVKGTPNSTTPDPTELPDWHGTQLAFAFSAHQEPGGLNSQLINLTVLHATNPHWAAGGSLGYSNDINWRISSALYAEEYTFTEQNSAEKFNPFIMGLIGGSRTTNKQLTTKQTQNDFTYGGKIGVNYNLTSATGLQLSYQVLRLQQSHIAKGDFALALTFHR